MKILLGWREVVGLPLLGIPELKAKVDTGARTSSLQAFDIATYERGATQRVRFLVRPHADDDDGAVACDVPLLEWRWVKDSGGHATHRPVIETPVRIGATEFRIEMSLAERPLMGFRMLLGREALRRGYVVDSARSYTGGTTTVAASD